VTVSIANRRSHAAVHAPRCPAALGFALEQ